jgi:hypothetical protein
MVYMDWLPDGDKGKATSEKFYDLVHNTPYKLCDITTTEPTGEL